MIVFENRLVLLFLLLLATLSSCELYFLHQSTWKDKDYGHYPDSIGINLQMTRYDDSGFLSEFSTAKKATHYPDSKTTLFENIYLQIFNHQDNPPWIVTARSGIAYGKGEKLQAAYQNHPASQLDTQNVTIFTDQKYMTTQAPIFASQPGMQVHGVGAKYDYDKNVLNLFDQVQVNYNPKK